MFRSVTRKKNVSTNIHINKSIFLIVTYLTFSKPHLHPIRLSIDENITFYLLVSFLGRILSYHCLAHHPNQTWLFKTVFFFIEWLLPLYLTSLSQPFRRVLVHADADPAGLSITTIIETKLTAKKKGPKEAAGNGPPLCQKRACKSPYPVLTAPTATRSMPTNATIFFFQKPAAQHHHHSIHS